MMWRKMYKMKIEIPKDGRMVMTGSSLKRAIQNNHMPLLDLFIRESVQNSLDAAKPNVDYINVDIGVGEFDSYTLAYHLEGIQDTIIRKFMENRYSYLYVRDSNTKGLGGPLHFSEKTNENTRDLLKLVYEIAKPQEEKGAGGSWGYGKTTYFRMGVGLVIYYSRTRTESGEFQSRLAACLVEDEKDEEALLRESKIGSERGLAWWGEEFSYNNGSSVEKATVPVTDEIKINNILSIFDIKPFEKNETGTEIVIPYIDKNALLCDKIQRSKDGGYEPYWLNSIEDYFRIAMQKWYICRLNNPSYKKKYGKPYLRVKINNRGLKSEEFAKPFVKMRDLYNKAIFAYEGDADGFFGYDIKLRNIFKNSEVGTLVFKRFSRTDFGMDPPENGASPFMLINNYENEDSKTEGRIILAFLRKPGMIISYEMAGDWTKGIIDNFKNDDVLMACFVLNSDNEFKQKGPFECIEDYFRASEEADHSAWHDIQVGLEYPRILNKIQQNIRKKINQTFREDDDGIEKTSSSLSKLFGEILLPPAGFGRKATSSAFERKKEIKPVAFHKNMSLYIYADKIRFKKRKTIIPARIKAEKPLEEVWIGLEIIADGNNIPLEKWEDRVGIKSPFEIENVYISTLKYGDIIKTQNILIDHKEPIIKDKEIEASLIMKKNGIGYAMKVKLNKPICFDINFEITISIYDSMAQVGYKLKDSE